MNIKDVANQLVALCTDGKFHEAIDTLYAPDVVSVEAFAPPGGSRESTGLDAVKAKAQWWASNHEVHTSYVDGPLIAGVHFSVTFRMDVTFLPTGNRHMMQEVAVYKVLNGKIVYEEFFYAAS